MFTDNIIRLDTVDSTNTRLKELADRGAAEGTVVLARGQTAGRGTVGRSFFSPEGEGLYLSVLLRPEATVEELFTLTGRTAVAVRQGIENACGAPCAIKWLNDLSLNGKKLCGILTELSPDLSYVVIGIGINLTQTNDVFAEQGLGGIATSLGMEGYPVEREALAASVLQELEQMYRQFPRGKETCLEQYRAHCLTLGRPVRFVQDRVERTGTAQEIDDQFGLTVVCEGRKYTVTSGTVQRMEEQV